MSEQPQALRFPVLNQLTLRLFNKSLDEATLFERRVVMGLAAGGVLGAWMLGLVAVEPLLVAGILLNEIAWRNEERYRISGR